MNDLIILKILSTKDNYDRFIKYIKNTSKEMGVVLKDMRRWYDQVPGRDVLNWPSFTAWFKHAAHPTMKPEVMEVYDTLFTTLETMDYEEEDAVPLLRSFVDRSVAESIVTAASAVADGEEQMDTVKSLIEQRDSELKITDDEGFAEWGKPIHNVRGSLRWRLNELNASVGPIGKGDFIIVGARPDAGKTTFLASEITHLASQLPPDHKLLWLNNEERLEKVQSRILTAALGIPYADIEEDWVKAYELYCKAINGDSDKIVLKDISGAYVSQVDRLVKKINPSVIVIDQLRKIHGYERETGNETSRQELVFNWARDLAKLYAPVITVHQADGSAEGQEWIDMSQLHMSKTGIQGEADAIITIGRTMERPNSRFIYIPKNKMQGDDPTLRNGKFEVEIDGVCARFKGAM